jgi:D-alanyl-D-alanine carboxypeptidase/D-alanyl-D-alanine-endopeptidase (penicillin-binding protein 4)
MSKYALAAAVLALAARVLPAEPAPAPALASRIDVLVRRHAPPGARVAVHLRAVADNAVLAARADDVPFVLASTTKLFTTAAALDVLGPGFEWVTVVGTRGERDPSGTLQGDLVVIGAGDPNLSGRFHGGNPTAVFERWADDLRLENVREVAGDLVLDDTVFDREFYAAPWLDEYLSDWFAAQAAGLSLNDNCVDLTIGPGPRPGEPAAVKLSPPTAYVNLIVTAKTVPGRGDEGILIQRRKATNEIRIAGNVGAAVAPGTHFVTVHDPVLYFGTVLKETLERKGIPVRGAVKAVPEGYVPSADPVRHLTEHRSALGVSLGVVNKRSQNFYAEQILRTLGWQKRGRGTRADGIAAVQESLKRFNLPEAPELEDGSGLGRGNRATARSMAALLAGMLHHPHARAFADSLAVPGGDGTLKKRFTEEAYRTRVKGKTGYIGGVSTLAGYLQTRGGRDVAFAILVNGVPAGAVDRARQLQDAIVKAAIDGE